MTVANGAPATAATFNDAFVSKDKFPNSTQVVSGDNSTRTTRATAVQTAINEAVTASDSFAFVPHDFLNYDASAVTFDNSVRMVREGQVGDVYDVKAYGAALDGTTDDQAAYAAAETAAAASGGILYHPEGTAKLSSNLTISSNVALVLSAGAVLSPDTAVTVTINGATRFVDDKSSAIAGAGTVEFGKPDAFLASKNRLEFFGTQAGREHLMLHPDEDAGTPEIGPWTVAYHDVGLTNGDGTWNWVTQWGYNLADSEATVATEPQLNKRFEHLFKPTSGRFNGQAISEEGIRSWTDINGVNNRHEEWRFMRDLSLQTSPGVTASYKADVFEWGQVDHTGSETVTSQNVLFQTNRTGNQDALWQFKDTEVTFERTVLYTRDGSGQAVPGSDGEGYVQIMDNVDAQIVQLLAENLSPTGSSVVRIAGGAFSRLQFADEANAFTGALDYQHSVDAIRWFAGGAVGGFLEGYGINVQPQSSAPASPQNGDIAYADGVGWNPAGDGTAGFFGREGGAWVKL